MADGIGNAPVPQPEHPQSSDSSEISELALASTSRRVVAFLIDTVLVAAFHFFLAGQNWLVTAVFFLLYHTVSLSVWGCTLGKAAVALKVQTPYGGRLNWKWALLRSTVGYLASAFFLLGFAHVFFDVRRRSWHDLLFGSEVVQHTGRLSFKQMIRAIDQWTEELDVWQKAILKRYHRLKGLVQLLGSLTLLITTARSTVEQVLQFLWGKLRSAFGRTGEAPAASAPAQGSVAPAIGTAPGVTAVSAAVTGAIGAVTSTVTATVLAVATFVIYEVSAPRALRPWDAEPAGVTVLSGDCHGTMTSNVTRGYEGDIYECAITIEPPLDKDIIRVITNNPGCTQCDANQIETGRWVWRKPFGPGPGTTKVEFVAYDKQGKIRCSGYSSELTLLGPKPP